MKKIILLLGFLSSSSFAYQTVFNPFTGKLDYVGVSSGSLPSGSTQYIQNTDSPTTDSQIFRVSTGTFANPTHSQTLSLFNQSLPINGGFGPQVPSSYIYGKMIENSGVSGSFTIVASTSSSVLDPSVSITMNPPTSLANSGQIGFFSSTYTVVSIDGQYLYVQSPLSVRISTPNVILGTDANGVIGSTTVPSGTPGGVSSNIQYNNSGSFGGASFFNVHASSSSTTADTVWTTASVGPVLTDANLCTWRTGVTTTGTLTTTLIACPSVVTFRPCTPRTPVGLLFAITCPAS